MPSAAASTRPRDFRDVKTGKRIFPLPHPSDVFDVAITHDGRSALTATKGGEGHGAVWFWNLATGKPIHWGMGRYIPGRSAQSPLCMTTWAFPVVKMARSFSGILLGGRQYCWRARIDSLACAAVFRDGRHALTGGKDGRVHYWNLATRKESMQTWAEHHGPIGDISISADGRAPSRAAMITP